MKKVLISLALLGAVSVGTMAFVNNTCDEPPSRDTELRQERHGWHGGHGDYRHHRRHGGCCGRERYRDDRRGYDCCGYRQECGACRYERCTSADCHRGGELCQACAEWHERHDGSGDYRRR